jgi:hypothetical protein
LNTKKYGKDRNNNSQIRRADSSSHCIDDIKLNNTLNIDADILCRSRRNEDHYIEELDYAILNLISNITNHNLDINNKNNQYDNKSVSTSHDIYPNQNKIRIIISDLMGTLEYMRSWDESTEERLLAITWLLIEYNGFNLNPVNNNRTNDNGSNNGNCYGNKDNTRDVNMISDNIFRPVENIDNVLTVYGKINNQLRKYKNLNKCLIKNKQAICKSFHNIPSIDDHGDSTLVFDLQIDQVLSDIQAQKNKHSTSIKHHHNRSTDISNKSGGNSISKQRSKIETNIKNNRDKDPSHNKNNENYDNNNKNITIKTPKISKLLHENVLHLIEDERRNMKIIREELFRRREHESAYYRYIVVCIYMYVY